MNLLFIYRRDIHSDDAGASRTIILRENFLAGQQGVTVYTSYHHLSPVDSRIIELHIDKLSVQEIHTAIINYGIDVLCVPEGEFLACMAHKAIKGTNCKLVTELHNKPNYALDVLFTSIYSSLVYPERLSIKIRALVKLVLYPLWKGWVRYRDLYRNKQAYILADKFVLLSESFKKSFSNYYQVDCDKMVAIPNPRSFQYCLSEKDFGNKKKTILVVSRLDEGQKRISLIIKCWKLIEETYPDWNLVIVGSGSSEYLYKQMVKRFNLKNVRFEGWQSPEKYYIEASIFLMTSIVEGWGMTIIEAQQKGCVPIVMDTYSALHDIIENEYNGLIVKNNDIISMAKGIEKLILDDSYRLKIAQNAVRSTERFSIQNVGQKWLNLYCSLYNVKS